MEILFGVRGPVTAFACGGLTPLPAAHRKSAKVQTGRTDQRGDRSPHSKELRVIRTSAGGILVTGFDVVHNRPAKSTLTSDRLAVEKI